MNLTPQMRELMKALEPVLVSGDYLKVGVSLSFEYQMFYWLFGMRTYNFYDCGMAEKCIWAGASSLKRYATFSMNEMFERYFRKTIDKQYQESFTLDAVLGQGQIDYAALDTRLPIAIKNVQQIVASGRTMAVIKKTMPAAVKYFEHLQPQIKGNNEPIILGDKLGEIIQIENDAIGAFEDMHIHGENIDGPKWLGRIAQKKEALSTLIKDELDPYFILLVGSKTAVDTDEEIEKAELHWKSFNVISPEELALKPQIRTAEKAGDISASQRSFRRRRISSKRSAKRRRNFSRRSAAIRKSIVQRSKKPRC